MGLSTNVASALSLVLLIGISAGLGCIVGAHVGDGQLSFVQEVSMIEIARAGSAKSLNCAAVNFCSIKWYKDGIPFPWRPREDAEMTYHLEDKGQFLSFKSADMLDKGIYMCVVSNGVKVISRTVGLVVLEKSHIRKPVLLGGKGGSCADQTAEVGDTVRFTCEFFVGKDQAAQSQAGWLTNGILGENTPLEFLSANNTYESIFRTDSIIITSLEIVNINEDSFGPWTVNVNNDGHETEVTLFVLPRPAHEGGKANIKSLLDKIKLGYRKLAR